MKTVTIEIEIPDGHEVVSTEVLANEYPPHCSFSGKMLLVKTRPAKPFLINGKPADWPEWLTCDWVAKDQYDRVWAYHFEPHIEGPPNGGPRIEGPRWVGHMHDASCLKNINAIDIPGPWEQSKRENPNRKK